MVGQVVEREIAKISSGSSGTQIMPTPNVTSLRESNVTISNEETQRVGIAVSLTLMVGLIQV